MIQQVEWKVEKRKKMTKGEMKDKRKAGFVPAILSIRGEESVPFFIEDTVLKNRPYGNFKIDLKVKGIKDPFPCFIKELHYGHIANIIIHADFQGLKKGQELDVDVPIELVGTPIGVDQGGVLMSDITSVRIRTLPRNMPEKITVDISGLNIGETIGVQDIEFKKEHVLQEPTSGSVASVIEKAKMEDEPAAEPTEPIILSEKDKD